jgi:threonine dehydrogenase-like Zn-dependent dehydrogenase
LLEPFACALHGVQRASPQTADTVLVIGCGAVGLLTIAALRALGCRARLLAIAKYGHQAQHARDLGADEVLEARGSTRQRYSAWAKALGAEVLEAEIGKPTVLGGADVVFDCVASARTIDDGIRFAASGGAFVLVGMPGIPSGVDWTPIWFKELTIYASYAYAPGRPADAKRDTFEMAIDLMRTWSERLLPLVGPPFELSEYRAAFAAALNVGQSRAIKTVVAVHTG